MRLLSLALLSFGSFAGTTLDLSARGVHVVYGPNEAGKSTALRAITGLFYGIPHVSPDAHTHRPDELRIGGRLQNRAGAEISVVRRKGRIRTLLDGSGAPLPEGALLPFLGGIGEEVFRAAFGLNHETLRLGAQALVEGKGHLGESLFGAGLGGTGVTSVLESLRKEAEEQYSPQARTRKLNLALRAVTEAKRRVSAEAMPASAWLSQEQAIRDAHEARAQLEEEALRLQTEERKLRRARTLVGLFAQLRAARAARASLGKVTLLPDDAAGERAVSESELEAATAQIRRTEETLARLSEQRALLVIPEALTAQADAVEDIATRLGSHRKAAVDLPRVRAELRSQEEEAVEIARALGFVVPPREGAEQAGVVLSELSSLRVSVARDERIRALAREAPALVERVRHAEEELLRIDGELSFLHARAALLPRPRDLGPLRRAEARAKGLGDVASSLDRAARAIAQIEERAFAARAALSLEDVELTQIARLPLPVPETIDLFAAEDRGLRAEGAALSARRDEARAALSRTEVALVEIGTFDLPTFADLASARERRAASLAEVSDAHERGEPENAPAALAELARAIEAADRVADRLRAEADRVAARARLEAEKEVHATVLAALKREEQDLAARTFAFQRRWGAVWRSAGIEPLSPDEMRGWLRRFEALVALVDQAAEARSEHDALAARAESSAEELRALLREGAVNLNSAPPEELMTPPPAAAETAAPASKDGAGGGQSAWWMDEPAPPDSAPPLATITGAPLVMDPSPASKGARLRLIAALPQLLEAAERELLALGEAERVQLAIGTAEAARSEAARRATVHRGALADHQAAWREATTGLSVREDASPAEVLRVLDTLTRLFTKLDEARRTSRRVEGMERDARELTRRVDTLVREHAPDLVGRSVESAAATLIQRFHQARADLEKHQLLGEQISAAQQDLVAARTREATARARLASLLAAAGVGSFAELSRAEALSLEAKRLDRQVEMLVEQLRAVGDNATEAELSREVEAFGGDAEALSARIDELNGELQRSAAERSQADRSIGALTEGLAKLREGTSAADAALELSAAVAEARSAVLAYARARAAALVLEREIDAYKKRHQGPVLRRAEELFRALTLGSFSGLTTGYDDSDEMTLRCVRDGGREVDIDGLSDGTRDQLYLALRLASLERFAGYAEPLPLVLDDAFVHFDDDRARAALLALADLSQTVQVLLFTHHDRLVDLAEAALADGCHVHRLR